MSDFPVAQRAQVLAEALPYIQKYYGKTIVVKYGGNAMISEELRQAVISDIILLHLVGIRVVVVHGGGPEISAMLKKIGKESRFVDGLRYTDDETMEVVQQVLCAMGYSKAPFRPEYVDISFSSAVGEILVCKQGAGVDFDEESAKSILSQDEVVIDVDLNEGEHQATCWGCDLTYDYVKINGDYRT